MNRERKRLLCYLEKLCGDVFKLLPMKEEEINNGLDNHINEHIEWLLINLQGAMDTFPELGEEKSVIYILNNLQYIHTHDVGFKKWRKFILDSTHEIDTLYMNYGGVKNGASE